MNATKQIKAALKPSIAEAQLRPIKQITSQPGGTIRLYAMKDNDGHWHFSQTRWADDKFYVDIYLPQQ